ncbi:MAG: ATP-binding protein [Polyangiales bacterium]
MRRQQGEARERERRTRALLSVARELSAAVDAPQALGALASHAAEVFDADVAVWSRDEGEPAVVATAGEPAVSDAEAARWCFERERPAGLGTDTLPRSKALCVPMKGRARVLGVLSVAPRDGAPLDGARRDLLDAFARLGASAMERATLAEDARRAAERARDEATRSALLSAVSHDLRTPLASITGAATTLRDDGDALSEAQRGELLDAVCDEAERMARMVNNLLDMTRLASGAVRVKREWVPLEEMVGSAMNRLERVLAGRPVSIDLPASLPLLSVDPVLFEQVLVNLLENAARHTPEGVAVDVSAEATEGGGVALTVADRGPGIAVGDESRVFEKFYRAPGAGPSGAGLGLTICEGIVRAHGGAITAARREGGGAEFRVVLPPAEGAPSVPEETAA